MCYFVWYDWCEYELWWYSFSYIRYKGFPLLILQYLSSYCFLPQSAILQYITPGPGQYKVPSTIGVKAGSVASIPGLVRSASFRVKKVTLKGLCIAIMKIHIF